MRTSGRDEALNATALEVWFAINLGSLTCPIDRTGWASGSCEKEQAVEESASVESNQGGRVLVVEDEEHVRDVTARLLQRAGYDVSTAPDAETALGMLSSSDPFDLVLTDSAMPGLRGEDLAAEITRVQPGLPVLLMSGYTDQECSPGSNAVVGYLQKPFAMPVLLAEVRRAIARERPSSE
jgi:DNA-binding NtrC family response regulator